MPWLRNYLTSRRLWRLGLLPCHLLTRTLFLVAATLTPLAVAAQIHIGTGDSKVYAVTAQPDGNIIAGGESVTVRGGPRVFTLARFFGPNNLDPSFGSGGIVQTPIGSGDSVIHAVGVQPDGKILAGGTFVPNGCIPGPCTPVSVLARYLPTGALDISFGSGGMMVAPPGNDISAIIVQSDGSFVVGATLGTGIPGPQNQFFIDVARYLPTGAPDRSFPLRSAGNAPQVCEITFVPCRAVAPVALGPDGSIVVGFGGPAFDWVRYDSSGVQSSLGPGSPSGSLYAVAVQFDGKIVAAGASLFGSTTGLPVWTLARYLPTGNLDPSFGNGGIVSTPGIGTINVAQIDNAIYALVVQPDGLIYAGGVTEGFDNHNFTIDSYDPAGVAQGATVTGFGGGGAESFLTSLALTPDLLDLFADGPVLPVIGGNGFFQFAVADYPTNNSRNTPRGTGVVVTLPQNTYSVPVPPVTVTFTNVTQRGVTSLAASTLGPTPPANFQLGNPPTYFYISTTALFTGQIQICIHSSGLTAASRLFHYENGAAVDVTTLPVDTVNQIICGVVTSLSPFVIGQPASQDTVPPTTTASVNPQPNAAGWNNRDVTVTLTSTDNEPNGSGVKQITYSATGAQTIASTVINSATASFTISTEGITIITFFGTDNAGNVEAANTLIIQLDKTPPTISGSATPAPNANGWNNTNVTVTFQCSDSLSGLAAVSPPAPTTLTSEGAGQSVTGTCTDVAGNSASATVSGINIDKTPPTIACSASPNVLWPPNHKLVDISTSLQVTDSLSGPAEFTLLSVTSNEPDSGLGDIQGWAIGTASTRGQLRAERLGQGTGRVYTFIYNGKDKAGNSAACSATVTVPHDQGTP